MANTLHFRGFTIYPGERRLSVGDVSAKPSARAFDLLMALVERRDRVVSKDELLAIVWPAVVVEENNLQVHIHALRKILGPAVISTVPGRGYAFTAESIAPESQGPFVERRKDAWKGLARGGAGPGSNFTTDAAVGNLPARLPALYGREDDLQALGELLAKQSLVTIAGAGGIGKTRLVQALGMQVQAQFAQGVWMVELAAVNDQALVLPVVAHTLGISMQARDVTLPEIARLLHDRNMLLILDNCEHLLDATSKLVAELVRTASKLRVVVTSQELLRVPGEFVLKLSPLAVPSAHCTDCDEAMQYGSVQLFVALARAVQRSFVLDAENLTAVVDICRRLDGIALAIELAAARVPLLGLAGIQQRLGERFRLLTGGARVTLRRHQTLRAALDWSHQLLTPDEQKVFRRLSVFNGGFTLESAQWLASDESCDEWAVLEHLSSLVDKSLVYVNDGVQPRYGMLETTRAYAMEALAAAGETDEWLARHARTTRAVCERAAKLRDMNLILAELSNVRAGFAWAIRPDGDPITAIALATSTSVVLAVSGMIMEGLHRLLLVEPLVDATVPMELAARYWQWLGRCGLDGRLPTSKCLEAFERAEEKYRELQNFRHLHGCLRMRAEALLETGALDAAADALDEARSMEDTGWTVADRMRRLRVEGLLHDAAGRLEESLATSQRALEMAQAAGISRYAFTLMSDMAAVRLKLGQADKAEALYNDLAKMAFAQVGDGVALAYAMIGLTAALVAQGKLVDARAQALLAVPLLRKSGVFLARCDIFAWLAAAEGHLMAAAWLIGASDNAHERNEIERDQTELRARREAFERVRVAVAPALARSWMQEGARASEAELVQLIQSPDVTTGSPAPSHSSLADSVDSRLAANTLASPGS